MAQVVQKYDLLRPQQYDIITSQRFNSVLSTVKCGGWLFQQMSVFCEQHIGLLERANS